jgi:hypothetical protein
MEIGPARNRSSKIMLIGVDEGSGRLFTSPAPGDLDQSEWVPQSKEVCHRGGASRCGAADTCSYSGYGAVAIGTQLWTRVGVGCGFDTPQLANQAAIAKCGAPLGLLAKDCAVKDGWMQ